MRPETALKAIGEHLDRLLDLIRDGDPRRLQDARELVLTMRLLISRYFAQDPASDERDAKYSDAALEAVAVAWLQSRLGTEEPMVNVLRAWLARRGIFP